MGERELARRMLSPEGASSRVRAGLQRASELWMALSARQGTKAVAGCGQVTEALGRTGLFIMFLNLVLEIQAQSILFLLASGQVEERSHIKQVSETHRG